MSPAPYRHPGRVRHRARPLRGLIRSVDRADGTDRAAATAGRRATSPSTSWASSPTSSPAGSTVSAATRHPARGRRAHAGSAPPRSPTSSRSSCRRSKRCSLVRRRRVGESVAERHRHARRGCRGAVVRHGAARRRHPVRRRPGRAGRRGPDARRSRTSPTCSPNAAGGRRRSRSTGSRASRSPAAATRSPAPRGPSPWPPPAEATPTALGLDASVNIYA